MFSIIIPLYNKAPYIEKAIRSVVAQTFQEFELIVIDDGSTDNSLLKVQKYKSSKVRIITQNNSGVSTARNNGVKLAKYDYIAFLDADDWWAPTYLEEMKGLIEDFPEAGIYGSSYYKVKNGKNIPANIGVEDGFTKGLINYCQVYAKTMYMPLTSITSIIKKSVFESENGFKSTLKLGEDFDLWVRVAMKYPVAFLNKPLAYYNQDVEQETRGVVDDKIYEPKTIYIFNLDYLRDEEHKNPDLKRLLDILRVYTLLRYRLNGAYAVKVKKEIDKVDFSKMPLNVKLNYFVPVMVLKLVLYFKKLIRNIIIKARK